MTSADCFFSSTDDLSDIISKKILNAKKSILLAMYTLTNTELIKSLIAVKRTQILAIFDEEQLLRFNKIILELNNHDIHFKTVGSSFARMHHKFLVIDGETTITGSFNWTFQANRKNDENLVIINEKILSQKYTAEFDRIWKNITQKSVFEQLKLVEQNNQKPLEQNTQNKAKELYRSAYSEKNPEIAFQKMSQAAKFGHVEAQIYLKRNKRLLQTTIHKKNFVESTEKKNEMEKAERLYQSAFSEKIAGIALQKMTQAAELGHANALRYIKSKGLSVTTINGKLHVY
jgi:hypothetical protein